MLFDENVAEIFIKSSENRSPLAMLGRFLRRSDLGRDGKDRAGWASDCSINAATLPHLGGGSFAAWREACRARYEA
jgi:hypothetical protein